MRDSVEPPPENTGRPAAPSPRYRTVPAVARRQPKVSAAVMSTKVCRVIGTGVPGTGILPAIVEPHSSSATMSDGARVRTSDLRLTRVTLCISSCISIPSVSVRDRHVSSVAHGNCECATGTLRFGNGQ